MINNELLNYDYEKGGKSIATNPLMRLALVLLTATFIFVLLPLYTNAATPSASGKTNASVQLRQSASTSSKSLGTLKKNSSVTINGEVFTSKTSAKTDTRWYSVTAGKKKGYIKIVRVKDIKYSSISAVTTDALNYRTGPGTSMKKAGTVNSSTVLTATLPAKQTGDSKTWYRVLVNSKPYYVIGDYLDLSSNNSPTIKATGKTPLAKTILANPTNGGRARYLGTLNNKNCKKVFSVKGDGGTYVPQGLAYTGSKYYVLFGMGGGQRILTYSSTGKKLSSSKFSFNMGHPNGITWDPVTGLCYIFKGNTKRIYTWNPVTNKFGKSKTPFSSSGIAYDSSNKLLFASSHTGIRAYSSDGKFSHQRLFRRCSHGISHYIQDCGAGGGYVFHGVSGSNKHKTNFLDIYRYADGKYLGSFKVSLGEIESIIVDNNGYVQLLINHKNTYKERIWRTPINVNDMV